MNKNIFEGSENQLVNYLVEIASELDVTLEKRRDGAVIAVTNELGHLKKNKNVFTFWPRKHSVGIIILGELSKTTFCSIEELINNNVKDLIHKKYVSMGLHYNASN